jgi:spermidine synthase
MVFELNGSRLLAPFLGTSIYIWTNLIGVILGALSVGYWLGGRMADRRPSVSSLSSAIFIAGGLVSLNILIKDVVLGLIATFGLGLDFKALFAAIILFAPASIALGFVLPFAVRLRLGSVDSSGATVGRLYALSTIGSIAGTFLAGFLLIPSIGSTRTMYLIAALLFATSIMLAPFAATSKNLSPIVVFVFAVFGNELFVHFQWSRNQVFAIDTQYSHLTLFQPDDPKTGRKIQAVANDPYFVQSAVFLDSDELVFDYNRHFHLAKYFKPDLRQSLMIGGAGYSFPRDYLKKYPGATIDVVEIDPGMTRVARDYFRLQDDPRMHIIHEDARVFLNGYQNGRYDVIFMDAFGTLFSVPYQLTTVEAAAAMKNALVNDGVLIANLGAAIEGPGDKFLRAELNTWRTVFSDVKVFKVKPERADSELQNLILVAFKQRSTVAFNKEAEFADLLAHEIRDREFAGLPVLTDDLAPVEYYNSVSQKYYGLKIQN